MFQSVRIVVLSLLASLVIPSNAVLAQKTPFTSVDVAQTQTVYSVAVSPNGQHIAYRLSVPRIPFKDKDGGAWTEIHVVNSHGKSRPFVTGKVSTRNLAWSPDSRTLLYLSKRSNDRNAGIYGIPIDGASSVANTKAACGADED